MQSYTAFGFEIGSTFFFPELLPGKKEARADVTIRETVLSEPNPPRIENDEAIVAPQQTFLAFRDLGTCVVRNGREMIVSRVPGSRESELRLALLGPAMAVLLQQRGFLVLHASVVDVGGRAVAFLGGSGWGKSTMAAALHARGHPLVVDDLAAVHVGVGEPRVYAGFPQYKLWPDAAAAIGRDYDALPRLHPDFDKRACRLADGFTSHQSLPLGHLFELQVGDTVAIDPMGPRDAVLALIRHSYGIEWLHRVSGAAQLHQRAELVRRVTVARLQRPYDLTALGTVVGAVETAVASAS